MEDKIKRFEELLLSTKREGIDRLLEFIRKSDFYTAPASTRFHSCHEGGLLEHSLNVYDCLVAKRENPIWKEHLNDIGDDSLILSSLLHDLCKAYLYDTELKNQKTYDKNKVEAADPKQVKKDNNGFFIWETVPKYKIEDKIPLGHGSKSVILAERYIKLSWSELFSINWHMGWSVPKEEYTALGNAFAKYPLAIALHEADQEATYLLEKEE